MRILNVLAVAAILTVPIEACTDARAESPDAHIAAIAQGDTLKVSFWVTRANTDSFTVDVSTLPAAHGTKHFVFPGTITSGLLTFAPLPKLAEGESVTVRACFRAYHLTLISASVCKDAAVYVQPVTPPTITPDSLKVVGWYLDPPGSHLGHAVTVMQGTSVQLCLYFTMGDSTVGVRTTATPLCRTRYVALYPAARRKISLAKQVVIDTHCVDWATSAGVQIDYLANACDTVNGQALGADFLHRPPPDVRLSSR